MDASGLAELLLGLGARASALLGLCLIALVALRRASASTRHLVSVAGLLGALALPLLGVLRARRGEGLQLAAASGSVVGSAARG